MFSWKSLSYSKLSAETETEVEICITLGWVWSIYMSRKDEFHDEASRGLQIPSEQDYPDFMACLPIPMQYGLCKHDWRIAKYAPWG